MSETRTVKLRRPAHGSPQPIVPFPLVAATTRHRARAVLEHLAELTGFRIAALSIVRSGQELIQLVEVVGAELSDADLEQSWLPLASWGHCGVREEWGVWRFRPADSVDPHDTRFDWQTVPNDDVASVEDGDWNPAHSLICELLDDDGQLRGALHLDAPIDGRVPPIEARRHLSAIGAMAAQSMRSLIDAELARQRVEMVVSARQVTEATPSATFAQLTEAARGALTSALALDQIDGYWFHPVLSALGPVPAAPASLRSAVIRSWRETTALVVPPEEPGAAAVLHLPVGDDTTCYGVLILERRTTPAPWTPTEIEGAVDIGRDLGRRLTDAEVNQRLHRQVEDLRAEVTNRARLASAVAHDLASPLHAIRNYLDLLDHPSVTTDQQRQSLLDAVRNGTEQASELAAQLTLLSREPTPEPAPTTDLAPVLQETLDLHVPSADADDQVLVGRIIEPTWVSMNAVDLRRVMANLTSNALKYTPPGGTIEATVTHTATEAVIRWRDSGIGISPSQLPHVFDEFYRTPDTFTQARPGTGLGLPIVKRLVENAHGTVTIRSTLGIGTTVEVRLPLADAPLADAPRAGDTAARRSGAPTPRAPQSRPSPSGRRR